MTFWKRPNYTNSGKIKWLPGAGWREEGLMKRQKTDDF
jgi:hypothetical protein